MTDMYQVTAEAVFATVDTVVGKTRIIVYKGGLLAADAPEIEHLVASNMVQRVTVGDAAVSTGLNADGGLGEATPPEEPPAPPIHTPADMAAVDAETERRRAEARAKLPVDGSAPDGRAGEEVWVEYAVTQGLDRDEATKAGKAELRKALGKG